MIGVCMAIGVGIGFFLALTLCFGGMRDRTLTLDVNQAIMLLSAGSLTVFRYSIHLKNHSIHQIDAED